MRIAVGGIYIECSTYSPLRTTLPDFRVLRGDELTADPSFRFLRDYPREFLPTLHARALPGGPVARAAYEELRADFLRRLKALGAVDGLYLAMHGAMYVEGMEDAEGDWIQAAREVVGTACLISASYDPHGNISQRVIDHLDMLSAYRTAPHIDVGETQRRACDMLVGSLETGIRPTLAWAPIPALFPGERTSTEDEPARTLYAGLPELNARAGIMDASLLVGYVWADEPRAGASAVLTGTDLAALHSGTAELARRYWDARADFTFGSRTGSIAECVEWARQARSRPVILADSGDNPTAGGVGDRPDVLRHLLERGVTDTLVIGIADPPATALCYQRGVGAAMPLRIGGALEPGVPPVSATAHVLFLLPTDAPGERQAVVRVGGVTLVLTARRRPFHTLRDFTDLGLDPKAFSLLVVKSGYLSP
ncbi:MAG TPA: M81 family metallopeptidase, partial [Chloroflexota bacterium]|nr:M81 family metallopeptidase [Chloroflexota bacterium]